MNRKLVSKWKWKRWKKYVNESIEKKVELYGYKT